MTSTKLIHLETILEKVNGKNYGKNKKWFFNSHLTKLNVDALEKDGYKVFAAYVREQPSFKVSW